MVDMEMDNNNTKAKSDNANSVDIGKHLAKLNDQWYPADVFQKRYNAELHHDEYYVHYDGFDKRYDQWLPRDHIKGISADGCDVIVLTKPEALGIGERRIITRRQKRLHDEVGNVPKPLSLTHSETAALKREHEALTRIKCITKIQMGIQEIDTWYFSPYPGKCRFEPKLWICEYCLMYTRFATAYNAHVNECAWKQPPGKEIYRRGTICIWEVDGSVDRTYCRNLCLLAKLYIDYKAMFVNVGYFMFYVMCQVDTIGAHIIGYFSKEKVSVTNNVACILTLPPYQRQGYGRLLIEFSYELSKLEGLIGSPERPISGLGLMSYRSYWRWALFKEMADCNKITSIKELGTGIKNTDIIQTLYSMNLLKYSDGINLISITQNTIRDIMNSNQFRCPKYPIERSAIRWTPPSRKERSSGVISNPK